MGHEGWKDLGHISNAAELRAMDTFYLINECFLQTFRLVVSIPQIFVKILGAVHLGNSYHQSYQYRTTFSGLASLWNSVASSRACIVSPIPRHRTMASSYKMELESLEEEQLMDSFDKDGDDASDLTSLPDSESESSSLQKSRRASAYEDEDGLTIRTTATETAEDFATLISTKDDPSLNPWTFRVWFTG